MRGLTESQKARLNLVLTAVEYGYIHACTGDSLQSTLMQAKEDWIEATKDWIEVTRKADNYECIPEKERSKKKTKKPN